MEYISKELSNSNGITVQANVDLDNFSILYIDDNQNIVRYIHDQQHPWQDDLASSDLQFDSKVVRIATPFTLIPSSEFSLDIKKRIARQAFPLESIEHVHHFIQDGIVGIYILSHELKSLLSRSFLDFSIEHVIQHLMKKQAKKDPSVLAHWTNNGLVITVYKNGLRLANFYKITAPEDAIYYLLSAYQYGELDPLTDPLHMSGRISRESVLFSKISGFVRDFVWTNQDLSTPEDFPFEPHLLYHLI